MSEGAGLYIAGPSLVKAAIGQDLPSDEIGGAKLHAHLSGTVDFREPDDAHALDRIRRLAAHWPPPPSPIFRRENRAPPHTFGSARACANKPGAEYEMRDIIGALVDAESFDEYKAEFGTTLVCGMRASTAGRWASLPTRKNTSANLASRLKWAA